MRKIIIWLTIFSVMNLIGCYYQEQMNPGDYTFDENSTMKITTKDTVYNFSGNDYYLVNDTLIAEVSKKLDKNTSLKFNVEIPVDDIEEVEVERSDTALSILLGLGIVVGVLGLIVLVALAQPGEIFFSGK
ncbi:MAG: hypothetical protein O6940_04935 [Ignavibacteria bacterium]|nr:hypothetical protein [Ignavibacteria bacterium]